MTLRVARIRALLGALFALLGLAIGAQLLLRPGGIESKFMGLGFAAVLVGLGAVRIRMYLVMRREQGP